MTKERLKRYRNIKMETDQLRDQLKNLETAIYYPKIQQCTGMSSATSPDNGQEKLIIRHLELQEQLEQKLTDLMEEQIAVENAIDTLAPVERTLIRAHYIDGKTWENVCVLIGYEWAQIHRIHSQALRKLDTLEDDNE